MIQTVLGVFLILLHIVCCVLVWLGIKTHLLKVKKYLMALVIFVPFWGTVCVLLLHLQMLTRRDNRIEPGVEKLRVNEEIYKNIFQAVSDTDKKIVPLEEALLINEPGVRRELIMDVLNDDPEEYMDLLKQARMNEDVEVVHYAITAMVELSKEYDFCLQKMEKLYAASPDDPEILEQYCDFMEEYLNQGILEAQMEREQRKRYIRLLRQKLKVKTMLSTCVRLFQNLMKTGDYVQAEEILGLMDQKWHRKEEFWILKIRYLAERKKGAELQEEVTELNERLKAQTAKLYEFLAPQLLAQAAVDEGGTKYVAAAQEDCSAADARLLLNKLLADGRTVAAVVYRSGERINFVLGSGEQTQADCRSLCRKAGELFGGRGGGSQHFAQGGGAYSDDWRQKVLQLQQLLKE